MTLIIEYGLDWVSRDLIEKPVEGRRGPATVSASESAICPLGKTLGRRRGAMNWSQENCLIDDHR